MAKIIAPNKDYSGISAGVTFEKGVGQTDDPKLIEWFASKGYGVADEAPLAPQEDKELSIVELRELVDSLGLDRKGIKSKDGLKKLIEGAAIAATD